MKSIKWKILITTCAVCLLPIFLGVALWDKLPDEIAIHFDINNQPDNFASKGFAVFGLPCIMAFAQAFCCLATDLNVKKHGGQKKVEAVMKWILPALTVVLQGVTFLYAMGVNTDIRRVAAFIVGAMLIVTGSCIKKLEYVKNRAITKEKALKINRFIGIGSMVMGILFLISIFLPPIATIVCVFIMIPYSIIGIIYDIKVSKK